MTRRPFPTRALRAALIAAALALPAAASADDGDRPRWTPSAAQRVIPPHAKFDQDTANGNLVAMTVTNYGFYGNNFFNRAPSLEYPAGRTRQFEHMVRGGLWVGARAQDANGAFTGVVTGTVDAAQGPTSPEASEFTPSTRSSIKRSTQPVSPFFDRTAISELDVVSDYDDLTPTVAASNAEPHRPMRIQVRQETFQWNFAEFQHILFLRVTVKNIGPVLRDVWVAVYTEFASGQKSAYTNWPPSSGDPTGHGGWYNNKFLAWDGPQKLLREHYCDQMATYGDLGGCSWDRAPYWIGITQLGSRGLADDTTTRRLTLSAWNWSPGNTERDSDVERYALLSTGVIQDVAVDSLLPGRDPVSILGAGPFPILFSDSTITLDFAIVGGAEVEDIRLHSSFAQFAYDNDYVLPVPPPAPRVKVVPRGHAARVYWSDDAESAFDVTSPEPADFEGYRLYLGESTEEMARIAQFDETAAPGDTAGFNTGFGAVRLATPEIVDGDTMHYAYDVTGLRDGFRYFLGVTAYDLGNSQITPLESGMSSLNRVAAIPGPAPGERGGDPVVFPNPYRVEARWDQGRNIRDHYIWFTNLPERCTVRIYTLSGDLVYEKEFDGRSYAGEGTRGIFDPSRGLGAPSLSGTTMAWNLITRDGQAIATGLYLYSVENRATGRTTVGKFLVVKSDREGR